MDDTTLIATVLALTFVTGLSLGWVARELLSLHRRRLARLMTI